MRTFSKLSPIGQGMRHLRLNAGLMAALAAALVLLSGPMLAQKSPAPEKTAPMPVQARTPASPMAVSPASTTKNQSKFSQAPSPVTARVRPPRRPRIVVDNDDNDYEYQAPGSYCAPAATSYADESDSAAMNSVNENGRVESMDRVQEIPDERGESMPRIGEN
jgi:hypothetical protein